MLRIARLLARDSPGAGMGRPPKGGFSGMPPAAWRAGVGEGGSTSRAAAPNWAEVQRARLIMYILLHYLSAAPSEEHQGR